MITRYIWLVAKFHIFPNLIYNSHMTKKDKIRFLDDIAIADTAFQVEGKDLNELFENAAEALTISMADINLINSKRKVVISLSNNKVDLLLFDFLNELLFFKDSENLLFSKYNVKVQKSNDLYMLSASVEGEKADPKKHKITTDVKAVTLHMFKLNKKDGIYKARIVVDI